MPHVGIALDELDDIGGIPDLYMDSDNNLALVFDAAAVAQHCKQRLKTFRGEWELDTESGTPWLDEILGKKHNPALAEATVKTTVVNTDGITGMTAFSVSFNPKLRHLSNFDIRANTIYEEEVIISNG